LEVVQTACARRRTVAFEEKVLEGRAPSAGNRRIGREPWARR
jgi:hypothetical protein